MAIRSDIIKRLTIVYIFMLLFGLIIVGRVIQLQLFEKDKWNKQANSLTIKDIVIESNRGDICAEDGRLLASSLPHYEIRMDLKSEALTDDIFFNHVDSLAICLADMFPDKTKNDYLRELKEARVNGTRSYLVAKNVTYLQLKQVKKFPIFRLGRYKGGVQYFQQNKRIHPYGESANRTIGRVKYENEPRTIIGIEGAYDYELRGRNGLRLMQKLTEGIWLPIGDENEVEPEDGKDVITTLDADIQDFVEKALHKALKKHEADGGTAVLMEVETGEIKAIANLSYKDGRYSERYNYAVGERTEPGSTFKLASLMAAMEDGFVDLNTPVDTRNGSITYYETFTVRDAQHGGFGNIITQKAFEYSSNVGISKIIFKNYFNKPQRFVDRLYDMGLNEKLHVCIKGEKKPYIKYPGDRFWSNVSLPQMAIGYEVELTPLQTLAFYNAVANNGIKVKPKFVKAIQYHGKTIKTIETELLNSPICSKKTIKMAQKMLEGVVKRGTAKRIYTDRYKIAGKTGTAKIYDKKTTEYVNRYKASFVGYFPADAPKYSCIVMVFNPTKYGYYGSSVAAPVFREIADKVYNTDLNIHNGINEDKKNIAIHIPYSKSGSKTQLDNVFQQLDIPVKEKQKIKSAWVVTQKGDKQIYYANRAVQKGKVPYVKGMGAKDAVYILERLGLKVNIIGRGAVVKQSIPPNTKISKGETITIELG